MMLESIWNLGSDPAAAAEAAGVPIAGGGVEDRRRSERIRVNGGEVFLFLPGDER